MEHTDARTAHAGRAGSLHWATALNAPRALGSRIKTLDPSIAHEMVYGKGGDVPGIRRAQNTWHML